MAICVEITVPRMNISFVFKSVTYGDILLVAHLGVSGTNELPIHPCTLLLVIQTLDAIGIQSLSRDIITRDLRQCLGTSQ